MRKHLALNPDDYYLRENFAQFLDQTGDLAEAPRAGATGQRIAAAEPHDSLHHWPVAGPVGERPAKLKNPFLRALAIRSDYVPALNELGLLLANQQKTAEAARYFSSQP